MMRIRIDGGQLTTAALRTIGEVSTKYARDSADLTDRQNIQLHWVRIEDVPDIWEAVEGVGLSTAEACGDVPRVILGSPLAGIAADEIIDGTPAVKEIVRAIHRQPRSSPTCRASSRPRSPARPGRTSRTRSTTSPSSAWCTPSTVPGFDLWVGGGLSTNPMLGQRLGAWVPLDEVPDVWAGRRLDLPRLRLPPAAQPGPAEVPGRRLGHREVPGGARDRSTCKRTLIDGPAPEVCDGPRDHVGVHPQNDGKFYVGVNPTVGRVSGTLLTKLADLVEAHGSDRVRTTTDQGLVILDIDGGPGRLAGRRAGTNWGCRSSRRRSGGT